MLGGEGQEMAVGETGFIHHLAGLNPTTFSSVVMTELLGTDGWKDNRDLPQVFIQIFFFFPFLYFSCQSLLLLLCSCSYSYSCSSSCYCSCSCSWSCSYSCCLRSVNTTSGTARTPAVLQVFRSLQGSIYVPLQLPKPSYICICIPFL